ncbi:alpha/beta fold hydrolase [Evansella tamaricis]|uniref:Alpha/beta hydrolase n=1 Tax=Evansella tamaricis TaxID=2069301 RepID=A0ABS6JJA5_9BACI|nr:alpha/beta hydrolase [Evansella tamaricis]MBU9713759.1 alpha/beta hydrolase [Evansella tamaricis]
MKSTKLYKEMITLSDVSIYCEYLFNGKPPILLIHGFVSSTYTFNRLVPLLEKHFSIIAIDLPGFGRSEKSTSFVYSFENYAKVVAECIDYFGLTDVYVVGHSMGGQIALYTAKYIPDKISKLVLLCSSGYLKKAKKLLVYSTYLPFFHLFVQQYIQRKDVEEYLKNVFYNPSYITEDHKKHFGKPLLEKNFYKSLGRLLRYREGDLSSDELKRIETPTLLLWGKEDRVVPMDVGEKLVKDLPNAKLKSFDYAGHLVTEERPLDVYKEIISYTSTSPV